MLLLRVINLLMFLNLVFSENEMENISSENKFKYIFTYPKIMAAGRKVTGCLSLKNVKLPGKLIVTFQGSKCNYTECQNFFDIENDYQCFQLDVPKNYIKKNHLHKKQVSLKIQLTLADENIEANGNKDITVFNPSDIVLIETDKSTYYPEELVQIRILALKYDMKPSLNRTISMVHLYGPDHKNIKTWKNITTRNGLVQLKYELEDASEGSWSLTVFDGGKIYDKIYFEVQRNNLSSFLVTLKALNDFNKDVESTDFKLCAKYFNGQPVKGVGMIVALTDYFTILREKKIHTSEKLKNGCVKLHVPIKELKEENASSYYTLWVAGRVIEQYTHQTKDALTLKIIMRDWPYSIYFSHSDLYLRPGLPYQGYLTLSGHKFDLLGKTIKLCYKFHSNSFTYSKTLDCQEICMNTTSERIYFTIPPLKNISNGQIYVKVDAPKQKSRWIHFDPSYSINNNSLKIIIDDKSRNCNEDVMFKVLYTLNNVRDEQLKFYYLLISRQQVAKTGYVSVKSKGKPFDSFKFKNTFKGSHEFIEKDILIGEVQLKVKLDGEIYTSAKLIVFYLINGEIIADDASINIKNCLPNKVDVKWIRTTTQSGEKALLQISSENDSLCALTGVEKSDRIQYDAAQSSDELIGLQTDNILTYNLYANNDHNYNLKERKCAKTKKNLEEERSYKSGLNRLLDVYWLPVQAVDASDSFANVDIGVISSEIIVTKPCKELFASYNYEDMDAEINSPDLQEQLIYKKTYMENIYGRSAKFKKNINTKVQLSARTALWDLEQINESHNIIELPMPDGMSNWLVKVLCVSKSKGVGLSEVVELNVFQPVSVDILPPYSIKKYTEIMHLPVIVYNNLNHSVPIQLTLADNIDMELIEGGTNKITKICVEAWDSLMLTYRIRGLKVGVLNVSFSIEVNHNGLKNCENENATLTRKVIYKAIKIENEGYLKKNVTNTLLCGISNNSFATTNVTWWINFPEGPANDYSSIRFITFDSNIFTPIITKFNNLFLIPERFCFKQMTAISAYNLQITAIYVLRHLKSNEEDTENKIWRHMKTCYSEILYYLYYTPYDTSNPNGLMFHTAFAIRLSPIMKKYKILGNDTIYNAVDWILRKQNSNGCFNYGSQIFQPMDLRDRKGVY